MSLIKASVEYSFSSPSRFSKDSCGWQASTIRLFVLSSILILFRIVSIFSFFYNTRKYLIFYNFWLITSKILIPSGFYEIKMIWYYPFIIWRVLRRILFFGLETTLIFFLIKAKSILSYFSAKATHLAHLIHIVLLQCF